MARKVVAATRAGIYLDEAGLRRAIIRYRRQCRKELYEQIRDLERKIVHDVGDLLPICIPAKRTGERDTIEELIDATHGRRFMVRHWESLNPRPSARLRFWGTRYHGTPADVLLDRVVERYGSWGAEEGQLDAFERFTALVGQNRRLRGHDAMCGMIKHGLTNWGLRQLVFSCEGELVAGEMLLQHSVDEAFAKALRYLATFEGVYDWRDMSDEDLELARDRFAELAEQCDSDLAFMGLLTEDDQCILGALGMKAQSWRRLVANRLGILLPAEFPVTYVKRRRRY